MKYKVVNLHNHITNDTIYCLGFFDGLHLGHQELIKETLKLAKKYNKKAGMLTFSSLLSSKIAKHCESKTILSNSEKEKIINSYDLDVIVYLDFDDECRTTSKKDFILFLQNTLNCCGVVVGEDFRFGYKGEGDYSYLKSIENNDFIVSIVSPIKVNNETISTTKIINYLRDGKIEIVNKYLGRNYYLEGVVKEGFHVGKTLEFPTANIEIEDNVILPLYGVYGVKVHINDSEYLGIANLGIRPSINTLNKPLLETHIFDFDGNIYNQKIKVELIKFIRKEKRFNSINELKEQIIKDKKMIKNN